MSTSSFPSREKLDQTFPAEQDSAHKIEVADLILAIQEIHVERGISSIAGGDSEEVLPKAVDEEGTRTISSILHGKPLSIAFTGLVLAMFLVS